MRITPLIQGAVTQKKLQHWIDSFRSDLGLYESNGQKGFYRLDSGPAASFTARGTTWRHVAASLGAVIPTQSDDDCYYLRGELVHFTRIMKIARNHNACSAAISWLMPYQTAQAAWDNCIEPQWIIWVLYRTNTPNPQQKALLYWSCCNAIYGLIRPQYDRIYPDSPLIDTIHQVITNPSADEMAITTALGTLELIRQEIKKTIKGCNGEISNDRLYDLDSALQILRIMWHMLWCMQSSAVGDISESTRNLSNIFLMIDEILRSEGKDGDRYICDLVRSFYPTAPVLS